MMTLTSKYEALMGRNWTEADKEYAVDLANQMARSGDKRLTDRATELDFAVARWERLARMARR